MGCFIGFSRNMYTIVSHNGWPRLEERTPRAMGVEFLAMLGSLNPSH